MNYTLTEIKEQHSWLYNYHSKMLQMVGKQVASARKIAKRRLSYRKSDDLNAFTYNQTGFKIENSKLILSKIGGTRIVLHRQPVNNKQVIISRKGGRWYAIATCDVLRKQYSIIIYKRPVGIDIGITKFAHDSDDRVINNPQFLIKKCSNLSRGLTAASPKTGGQQQS